MKKLLNLSLLVSFAVTVLEPLTGIQIHKLASVIFLLLCVVHTLVYRRKLGTKKYLLLGLVGACFLTGLMGMLLDQVPLILMLHRVLSLGAVFCLAIHIFIWRKKL